MFILRGSADRFGSVKGLKTRISPVMFFFFFSISKLLNNETRFPRICFHPRWLVVGKEKRFLHDFLNPIRSESDALLCGRNLCLWRKKGYPDLGLL